VYFGTKNHIILQAARPISVLVPKNSIKDLKIEVEYKAPIKAPIEKGQEVGRILIHLPNSGVKEVPLVSAEIVLPFKFSVPFESSVSLFPLKSNRESE